jgi:hypothetical protein
VYGAPSAGVEWGGVSVWRCVVWLHEERERVGKRGGKRRAGRQCSLVRGSGNIA